MYILKEILEKNSWQSSWKLLWNNFIINNFKFYSFLNSWEWWEFNKAQWNKVFKFWIYNQKSDLIWVFMMILHKAKRWTYLFCPHWPQILENENYFEVLEKLKPELERVAKENNVDFLRLNSVSLNTKENFSNYKKIWFKDAPMHVHAEDTHLLDLDKNEEEMMANLRKTTRYMINRARKEWVKITNYSKEDWNFEEWLKCLIDMHIAHSNRLNWKHKYSAFSEKYIRGLFEIFDEKDLSLISASYMWQIEAILMTIKFWETCVYYISASDIKNPKFSPSYLLQWEAIMKAKNDWCKIYNFWWISPDWNPKHPIQWVTLFKRGFWWYDYSLSHAKDLVFNKMKYSINYLVESFRRLKRGYYYKKPE